MCAGRARAENLLPRVYQRGLTLSRAHYPPFMAAQRAGLIG